MDHSTRTVPDTGLSLQGVLDTALPPELGTESAPALYTVPAVFTRRVSPQERALVEDDAVTRRLSERGFPGVTLTVEDRRLLIGGTSLTMLESGLAHEIAVLLREVEEQVSSERDRAADELTRWHAAEAQRAAVVREEAGHVRFE